MAARRVGHAAQVRYVIVLTGPRSRRFGIAVDASEEAPDYALTRGPVVVDVDADVEVGEAGATCQPIVVDIGRDPFVLFAGTSDFDEQAFTAVDGHPFPVRDGVWLSFPEPFLPGRAVTVAGLDADERELFRITSEPLMRERLRPMFGPAWTGYVPLTDEE